LDEEFRTPASAYYMTLVFLDEVKKYFDLVLTDKDKASMVNTTISALNCGDGEADRNAFETRLKALCSGDDELIEKIEYLHEVI